MKLSIIIPAYNEEGTLEEILRRVSDVDLGSLKKEIIIVDDGSTDATASIISSFEKTQDKNFKSQIPNVTVIKHKKNQGKGAAVQTGIKAAKGEIILIQDADLEYNPKDIPMLVQPVLDGKALVVYGTRLRTKPVLFGKNRTPLLLHFFGNKFLSFITSLLYGYTVTDMETGYKVFDHKVLDGIKLKAKSFDFEPEITAKILKRKIKIVELDIKTQPRGYEEGKKIHTFRDGFRALWVLTKYKFSD